MKRLNSDVVNPMVIKELRQGLKSKSFLATFLGLQAAMVLSMFIYLTTASTTQGQANMEFADGFFWFMLALMLLFGMPLRAFNALHEEVKGNTLEMLFLTRMDSWKIAFGKWCALALQILLLVSAVLPYLVLRYFMGGIDVAGDLIILFLQIIASMLFVSVGVGLSGWTSKLLRGLILLGAFLSLYMIPMMMFGISSSGGGGAFSFFGWFDTLVYIVCTGILMMLFVEYGASQIAPPAENHSLRKRLLALSMVLIIAPYAVFYGESGESLAICMVVLIPVAIDALCEPLIGIPSVYRGMRKLGPLRWFFFPGWVSGFLFVTAVFWILFSLATYVEDDSEILVIGQIAYNTLIFPFFLIRLIPALTRKTLLTYFSVQVLSLIFCFLMVFLEEIHFIADYVVLGHFIPLLGFMVIGDTGIEDLSPFILGVVTTGMVAICMVRARIPVKQMQYLSRGAQG